MPAPTRSFPRASPTSASSSITTSRSTSRRRSTSPPTRTRSTTCARPSLDLDSRLRPGPGARSVPLSFPASATPDRDEVAARHQHATPARAGRAARHARRHGRPDDFDVRACQSAHHGGRRHHGDHRRSAQRREPHRLAASSRDAALPQRRRRPPGGRSFPGDIFAEAKRIVTHHYQWAVVHDFLKRICGAAAVNAAMAIVVAPVGSAFRMPVEFAVAAYRFGHSMIRERLLGELHLARPQHARDRSSSSSASRGCRCSRTGSSTSTCSSTRAFRCRFTTRRGESTASSRTVWKRLPGLAGSWRFWPRAICDAASRWVCRADRAWRAPCGIDADDGRAADVRAAGARSLSSTPTAGCC